MLEHDCPISLLWYNHRMEKLVLKRVVSIVKKAYRKANRLKSENIVENKELNDVVSSVDRFMETEIIAGLKRFYPEHGFIGEEFGQQNESQKEYDWLIDPIDGTINYIAGIPLFGTSVALRRNKTIILGVVFDWTSNDVYYAIIDKGAYKNKDKLTVSDTKELKDSIVTLCLTSHYNEEHTKEIIETITKLSPKVRGLRLIVCSTVELGWLASGKTDGMINIKPSIGLSSAAGKLLVTEAGGVVTNILGKPRKEIDTLLVTNGLIHDEILKALNG